VAHYACAVSGRAPICLLVNPAAGGGKAARLAPEAERELRSRGLSLRRADTRDLQHARELALAAARAGEQVVVLSGDGMIGVVAETLRAVPGAVLGVLPGGRGNDLARALGVSLELAEACATVAGGLVRQMDVGEVVAAAAPGQAGASPPRTFVGIASAGFDSDANRIANDAPSWLGNLVYAYGALRALIAWRPAAFTIELDPPGERRSFTGYTVGACNSRSYGGGMRAAPDALLDDGLLEVMVLERVGKLAFLTKILPRVFSGEHVNEPCVHVFRAREVAIEADRPFTMYADGDPIGELPLRVRAVPGAVNVLVPAGGDGAFSPAAAPTASAADPGSAQAGPALAGPSG
jgi:YegS/Rv2252/BmrU family lipid kinase